MYYFKRDTNRATKEGKELTERMVHKNLYRILLQEQSLSLSECRRTFDQFVSQSHRKPMICEQTFGILGLWSTCRVNVFNKTMSIRWILGAIWRFDTLIFPGKNELKTLPKQPDASCQLLWVHCVWRTVQIYGTKSGPIKPLAISKFQVRLV